jgi:protein TonB
MLNRTISLRPTTLLHWTALVVLLAACSTPPPPPKPAEPPVIVAPPPPPVVAPTPAPPDRVSQARSARDYRRDAAGHLYARNKDRIYPGKMPPLLHAVGVLQVEIDARGNVLAVSWMRAPSHAPDVMATIERAVRQAAPYPAPMHLGRVTYTDTWLWHKSGFFQLDTLTEGQL